VQHKRRQEAAPVVVSAPPQRGLAEFPSLGAPAKKAPVASSWKGKVVPKGNVIGKVLPQTPSSSPQVQQAPSFQEVHFILFIYQQYIKMIFYRDLPMMLHRICKLILINICLQPQPLSTKSDSGTSGNGKSKVTVKPPSVVTPPEVCSAYS